MGQTSIHSSHPLTMASHLERRKERCDFYQSWEFVDNPTLQLLEEWRSSTRQEQFTEDSAPGSKIHVI